MSDTPQADCAHLPIARPGAIQSFAGLIAVDRDWRILCASDNLAAVLGTGDLATVGAPLVRILPASTVHRLRGAAPRSDTVDEVARLFDLRVGGTRRADVALYPVAEGWVIEAEPARRAAAPLLGLVHRLADRARARPDIASLLDEAVRGLAALTGFDRVLAYRFEADASGRVVAETDASGPPRFLGLRFPATDIPPQARAMYARNLLRVIADTESPAVPLSPATAAPDLTLSMSRAVAPVHLDYLRAMGVRASMSVSLPGDETGSLWGLLACHHPRPHAPDYAMRSAVELYGQILGHEIASRRRSADREAARALERAAQDCRTDGPTAATLLPVVQARLGCDGVALVPVPARDNARDGETAVDGAGLLPGVEILRALAATPGTGWHETRATADPGWGQANLAMALPMTRQATLVLVRRRPPTADLWAGNPADALTAGPARSFAIWRAGEQGQARTLDPGERDLARGLATHLAAALPTSRIDPDPAGPGVARRIAQAALLADEARHRARHAFQLAAALARSTLPAPEADRMARALAALAVTTAAPPADPGDPVRLSQIIAAEIAPWRPSMARCVVLPGDDPVLPPEVVMPMTIAVHELAANAARHGALTRRKGRLYLRLRQDRTTGRTRLLWVERDGPRPDPAAAPGTGRTIVTRALATVPGGKAWLRLGARGFVARLSFDTAPGAGRFLVIEDDPLVAADLVRMLADLGHVPCAIARTATDAARQIAIAPPVAVLCDLSLGDDSGWPIVALARAAALPVVVVTGAETGPEPPADGAIGMLTKPVSATDLAAALARVLLKPSPPGLTGVAMLED
ncbi:MAG: GAF domain-containing protein [Rhodobacteraceae bacterium]|nr:GAF domain-containing protein [Paracoccaceae bacterium]